MSTETSLDLGPLSWKTGAGLTLTAIGHSNDLTATLDAVRPELRRLAGIADALSEFRNGLSDAEKDRLIDLLVKHGARKV